ESFIPPVLPTEANEHVFLAAASAARLPGTSMPASGAMELSPSPQAFVLCSFFSTTFCNPFCLGFITLIFSIKAKGKAPPSHHRPAWLGGPACCLPPRQGSVTYWPLGVMVAWFQSPPMAPSQWSSLSAQRCWSRQCSSSREEGWI
uniref:Uncharacterized protein n=1 Tax=Falco tinnunculus TaxID=100819 RepID=A0A8C4TSC8_FALTI